MIELQIFKTQDAPELISKIKDKRALLQFAGPAYLFPLTREQLDNDLNNENRFMFRIFDTTEQNTIGHAQIFLKEDTFLLGRILIWDENNRGKGYGKKTVMELLQYGFNTFDRKTAELNVYDWNTGAIECYKKVGFEIDPDLMNEASIDNEIWISINMKISKNAFESGKL
ncbi:GNAT family N-acetyltransferase [Chryseobacterium shigense]|uniref:Protein N-acetyltransferase, RimJ/RimL family n=1 Tax=Chryseobacterium shigense TaxID=297244 RepID=A0A1N7HYT0_9FLAO|nr:GNAT family protein [Chryseobacterium shigense]PQA90831.1 GNAT family N-acetyltransferase [Chryseobacterium shigense]SIS29983.1 Protein N-acetyltransferase, RimJ/RimL family [Chryseobacterium shigense]